MRCVDLHFRQHQVTRPRSSNLHTWPTHPQPLKVVGVFLFCVSYRTNFQCSFINSTSQSIAHPNSRTVYSSLALDRKNLSNRDSDPKHLMIRGKVTGQQPPGWHALCFSLRVVVDWLWLCDFYSVVFPLLYFATLFVWGDKTYDWHPALALCNSWQSKLGYVLQHDCSFREINFKFSYRPLVIPSITLEVNSSRWGFCTRFTSNVAVYVAVPLSAMLHRESGKEMVIKLFKLCHA